jgi:hypothetical protein
MRIVGIDPGETESAYVLLVDGKIKNFGMRENQKLYYALKKSVHRFELWVEEIQCYGMAVGASTFSTCKFTGALQSLAWDDIEFEYKPVGRRDIKWLFCNSSKATDANVNRVMKDIWGEKGTKKNPGGTYGFAEHTYAALAVATYGLRQNETK